MTRWLNIEPAAIGSALAAVYAVAVMLYRAFVTKDAVFQPDLIVAAFTVLWGIYTRAKVTPIALPRDAEGRALTPNQQ